MLQKAEILKLLKRGQPIYKDPDHQNPYITPRIEARLTAPIAEGLASLLGIFQNLTISP
jgi:hypothetical protein